MTFRQWLIHTCTIQDYSTGRLATGELSKTWSDKETLVNCRWVVKSERVASERVGGQVVTTLKLLLPAGTDVSHHDRIADVRLKADNSLVDAGPFQIEEVVPRNARGQRHISLMLERIEGNE